MHDMDDLDSETAVQVLEKIKALCEKFDTDSMKPEEKEPEAEQKDEDSGASDFGHAPPDSDEAKLKALAKK